MDLAIVILKEILNSFFKDDIYNMITRNTLSDKITKAFNRAVRKVDDDNKRNYIVSLTKNNTLKEIWQKIENDNDFLLLFADELKEDIHTYLYFHELQLASYERNRFLSPLLNLDERYYYPDENAFLKIFPHSEFSIEDLFIEPDFSVSLLNNEQTAKTTSLFSDDIVECCKDILKRHNLLFICGPYGSGKTFLSKYLLSKLTDGYSLYIYANKLPCQSDFSIIFSHEAIRYLLERHKKLYVFFDSFESYANDERDAAIETFYQLTQRYQGLRFIVNMRKPEGVYLDIFAAIEITFGSLEFIELQYFSQKKVQQWVTLYSLAAESYKMKACFTYDEISKANKNLKTSCSNPLLLVMMAESQDPMIISNNQGWFNLFDGFIQKTIKGKFQLENKINHLLQGNTAKYKEFIYEIASKIFEYSQQPLDLKQYNDPDFILDPNTKYYSIKQEEVRQSIRDILNIDADDKLLIQYLSCYFFEFECSTNRWKFKDNNVLFFLCASKICTLLFSVLDTFLNNKPIENSTKRLISSFKNFPLHPVVIEFILDKIINSNKKEDICALIKDLLNQNVVINIPQKDSFIIDYNKIKFDILLSIVFLRLNKHEYKTELNHYFKRISQYYSFVKIIDKDISSIIQRYYRNLIINNAEIRRINFKGYNWNNSLLKKVLYIQCKFQDTSMCNIKYKDVKFNLCYLNNIKFMNFEGNVNFHTCELKKTTFGLTKDAILFFSNCIIDNVWIKCTSSSIPFVTFNRCDIRQLHIECDRICFSLLQPILSSKIHLHATKLFADQQIILQLGGVVSFDKIFDKDSNSYIISRENLST